MELVPATTTILSRYQFPLPSFLLRFLLGLLFAIAFAAAVAAARAIADHSYCRKYERRYQDLLLPSGDWVRVPHR